MINFKSILTLFPGFLLLGCGGDDDTMVEPFSASVSIALSPESVEEGELAQLVFTLSETNTSGSPLAVAYAIDGSASDNDFTSLTGTASVPVGEATTGITIATIDDDAIEQTETLAISLDADGTAEGLSIGSPNSVVLTIIDNDEPTPTEMTLITISTESTSVQEGQSTTVTVALSRANATGSPLSLSYEVSGTAISGEDFNELSGSVEISAGSLTAEFTVEATDDMLMESAESIIISLSTGNLPENFSLGDSDDVTITIEDNDISPDAITISVEASSTGLDENGGTTVTVSLSRANDTGSPIEVVYDLAGTATEGIDYEMLPGSVTIANGEQNVTFDVIGIDDSQSEDDETITIELLTQGLPQGVIIGMPASVELEIMDDDIVLGACSGTTDTYSIDLDPTNCTVDIEAVLGINSSYSEQVSGNSRIITTNAIPNHNVGQFPNMGNPHTITEINSTYNISTSPTANSTVTLLTNTNTGAPLFRFGVLYNGILLAPIAAEFFTNTQTGSDNTDWNENALSSEISLGTDCNNSHVFPSGMYHHHATPSAFIASMNIDGSTPVQIGWAADGYPIYYKYGNKNGSVVELTSGYQLKTEERGGDGISAPSGCPDGTYTQDYQHISGLGDLDECNGYQDPVLGYIYVITDTYPSIPRCFVSTPSNDFRNN